ncbi:MAG: hypothetical protein LLG01_02925 [Planctomycetaceae bacterium]|nr:hypothetical protein [Planctomycetaceae bacterium]
MASQQYPGGNRSCGAVGFALLLTCGISLSGCIAAAAAIAVIAVSGGAGTGRYTAKVVLKVPPDKVWAAGNRILARRPDILVSNRNDATHELEFSRGKNKAVCHAEPAGDGTWTQLTIAATENEKEATHEELALKIVEQICTELGVKYQVMEGLP